MSRGSKSKSDSVRSSLLSLQENEKLEDLLGRRCAVSSELTGEFGVAHCGVIHLLYLSSFVFLYGVKSLVYKWKTNTTETAPVVLFAV